MPDRSGWMFKDLAALRMVLFSWAVFSESPQMRLRAVASVVACVLFACMSHGTARSAELKIFASRAIGTVLAEIGPKFEQKSAYKLNVITGLSSEFVGRIDAGETFDVIAASPLALDDLIRDRKVTADSNTNLARSAMASQLAQARRSPTLARSRLSSARY
jgi:ABC-type molybdate transport system substrate-binding protein